MELDAGALYSLPCENDWKTLDCPTLQSSHVSLRTYDGNYLQIRGSLKASITINGCTRVTSVIVVSKYNAPPLFGRDWLQEFPLDWSSIKQAMKAHANQ